MPRSFALGSYFEDFIDAQVEGGRYNNASEVVRDALRLLEEKEKRRKAQWAELRKLADEGLESGLAEEDGWKILDRLEAKYEAMIPRAKK